MKTLLLSLLLVAVVGTAPLCAQFRVSPYLQDPQALGMTVMWLSERSQPGELVCWEEGAQEPVFRATSTPREATALAYAPTEAAAFPGGTPPPLPFLHRVAVTGLKPSSRYRYEVTQGSARSASRFKTAPDGEAAVRFVAYSDCETEPESSGAAVVWSDPKDAAAKRLYLVDQTAGYAANLAAMQARQPDFAVIPGDLVESGGEQRDWDEFWRHNSAADGTRSFAASIPILPALGNHEYYAGPQNGGYEQPASEKAVAKYLTYFCPPANGAPVRELEGRYYSLRYGPVALLVLDVNNGLPENTDDDTSRSLTPPFILDFHPGSAQYVWLERELQAAQRTARFTFVLFHQTPWSSGVHGAMSENLSGAPTRVLMPLFFRYGVDALITGHDEMFERSEVKGEEDLPTGGKRPHTIQIYDVGVGGDGLRGPAPDATNPYRAFLAHTDSPEVWTDGVLTDGGKHYGHLEVNVRPAGPRWEAEFTPVYVLPIMAADSNAGPRFERRVYPDVRTLFSDQ